MVLKPSSCRQVGSRREAFSCLAGVDMRNGSGRDEQMAVVVGVRCKLTPEIYFLIVLTSCGRLRTTLLIDKECPGQI